MSDAEMKQRLLQVADTVKEGTVEKEDLINATTAMYRTLNKLKTEGAQII